jgi:hypothetical protein
MTSPLDELLNSSRPRSATGAGVDSASRELVARVSRVTRHRTSRRLKIGIGSAIALSSVLSATAALGSTAIYDWAMGSPDFTVTRTFAPPGFATATCELRWRVVAQSHETPRPGELDEARAFIGQLDFDEIEPDLELLDAELNAGWWKLSGSSPATVEAGAYTLAVANEWFDHARSEGFEAVATLEGESNCSDVATNE